MKFLVIAITMLVSPMALGSLSASPSYINFSTVDVDRPFSQMRTVYVRNNSKEIVNLSVFKNCGMDFSITDSCYASIGAYGSCTINISYRPWREGWHNCNITIQSRQAGMSARVTASGRAQKYP